VYLGPDANGNQVSNVMMGGIGQAGYLAEHNGENTVSGGFVSGFGGNTTVIKSVATAYNYFMSVLAEPGPGSQYFDFDDQCIWNTVIGQDNCFVESTSRDTNFMWLQQGKVRVGDFNTSFGTTNLPPQLEKLELQVEGHGYVRTLDAGAISSMNITCAANDSQKPTTAVDLCAVAAEKDDAMAAVRTELSELRAALKAQAEEIQALKALVLRGREEDSSSTATQY
jgi:hypothetical protein